MPPKNKALFKAGRMNGKFDKGTVYFAREGEAPIPLGEGILQTLSNFAGYMRTLSNFAGYMRTHPRVAHLALHGKNQRIRKKNAKRILRGD